MADVLQFPEPTPPDDPDAEQRAKALDITQSIIVEAPAGSGKTGLLIQRFLHLLASEAVSDPAQVLAITFTRKATHEMRDRMLRQLEAARGNARPTETFDQATRLLAEAVLERDTRLGWDLLRHPERLNISTIDALSIRIASSLPVLSGGGGQSPVEDATELYGEAARRTLGMLGGADAEISAALETLLRHRDGELGNCESLIAEMLQWREQWANLMPLTGEQLSEDYLESVTLPMLEKALDQAICRALTRIDQMMPPALCQALAELAHRMSHAEGLEAADSPLAVCRELRQAPGLAATDLDHWRALADLLTTRGRNWRRAIHKGTLQFAISPGDRKELAALIEQFSAIPGLRESLSALAKLPPVEYPREPWRIAKALFRVLSRALVELQLVFAERGECDFTEFSLLALEALRRGTALDDLAASIGFSLEHLLVDEMQDTSSSQYELIRLLTQGWDGHSQTVFLVGDPKQSIYLFRQARVARFLETLRARRLGDLPLTALSLTANFRSQANLVTSFNETFPALFPAAANQAQDGAEPVRDGRGKLPPSVSEQESIAYRAASAHRERGVTPALVWHVSAIPYSADTEVCAEARRARRSENAEELRRLIEQWTVRPLPPNREGKPWRIAVLVRSRRHLAPIARALNREPAIPFRAVRVEPLGERQEVLDLLALTRALLHPADRTAWFALLRTPWCGLTLADLHRLAGEDESRLAQTSVLTLIAERGHELSPDGIARLEPFWTVMSAALRQRGRMPLSQWVSGTWRTLGTELFLSGEQRANADQFFELLDEVEDGRGAVNLDALKSHLEKLYAAESNVSGAVELMTIHNAKGLEWDFVAVPELEASSGRTEQRLFRWTELEADAAEGRIDGQAHAILAPVQARGQDAQALTRWIGAIESAREAAERRRLFYVACTRAREELHLFAAPDRKKAEGFSLQYDSLLAAAWPAAERFFVGLPEERVPVEVEQMAAAAGPELVFEEAPVERTIDRIPLPALQRARASKEPAPAAHAVFERPEGSFEARAFGNAMHAFLDVLSKRMASGAAVATLLEELRSWTPRVSAVLRSSGLAETEVARAAANVLRGLSRTLGERDGQWILSPRPEAWSEATLVSAAKTLRLDRMFLAGAEPRSSGTSHLWIVDFKTGTHGAENAEAYLTRERERYAGQLEAYAEHMAARGLPMRVALYHPMLGKLTWWTPREVASKDGETTEQARG